MTTDERLDKLTVIVAKQAETAANQSAAMDKIIESFREFRSDRVQMNGTMQTLIQKVDKLTDNVDRLEKFFERSLTKPPNGKTKK